jgi:hypothetical protein
MLNKYREQLTEPSIFSQGGTIVLLQIGYTMAQSLAENCRRIGNPFNVRTIVKIKRTLRGILTKSGPVRGAQQSQKSA